MEIFKLFGSIFVDNDEANKSIAATEDKAKSAGNTLGGMVGTAAKWGAAIVGGAAAGGAALLGMANKASETASRVQDMSAKIGMSTTGFQEWDYTLGQAGIDVGVLQGGFKKFSSAIDGATQGGKSQVAMFKELGVSLTDTNGKVKSTEQLFNESVLAFTKMESGAHKSTLANQLFGKSSTEMGAILNGTAKDITDAKDRAHELGLVLSNEAVNTGDNFGDTMENVTKSLGAVVTQVGVALMPIMQSFLDWVQQHMPEIQKVIEIVMGAIKIAVEVVWTILDKTVIPVFKSLYSFIQSNSPEIQKLFEQVFGKAKEVFTTLWDFIDKNINPIFKSFFEWIQKNMPTIQTTFATVFSKISELLSKMWEFFKTNILPILADFYKYIQDKLPTIQGIFEKVFKIISDVVSVVWSIFENNLLPILKALWDFIKPTFPLIGDTIKVAFDIVIGVVDAVTSAFQAVTDAIKGAIDWINSFNGTKVDSKTVKVTKVTSGGGGASYAVGTNYVPYDMTAQIHEGEMIVPKSDNPYANPYTGTGRGNIIVNVNNPKIFDSRDADALGNMVVKRLKQLGVTP